MNSLLLDFPPSSLLLANGMETINVNEISVDKGLVITLNASSDWLVNLIKSHLSSPQFDPKTLSGELGFTKTNNNVDIYGEITFSHKPYCARCGLEIDQKEKITIAAHLTPAENFPTPKTKPGQEIQLSEKDLDNSFYKNDIIQIEDILNDEIALNLPYNYYCQNNPNCQTPEPKSEHITLDDKTDPRWAPLAKLKK